MNTPEWLKPSIYGAVIGAVFVGVVGFSWGGWVTGGTADTRATAMARNQVIAAIVPVCLDMARVDPDRVAHIDTIRKATTYKRHDAVMETGWATIPGTDVPDRDIAQACLAGLDVDKPPERAENTVEKG